MVRMNRALDCFASQRRSVEVGNDNADSITHGLPELPRQNALPCVSLALEASRRVSSHRISIRDVAFDVENCTLRSLEATRDFRATHNRTVDRQSVPDW